MATCSVFQGKRLTRRWQKSIDNDEGFMKRLQNVCEECGNNLCGISLAFMLQSFVKKIFGGITFTHLVTNIEAQAEKAAEIRSTT